MADPALPAGPVQPESTSRYAAAFSAWLVSRGERELGVAYALGREAVASQRSVMELAEAHHRAVELALRDVDDPARHAELLAAACEFFREALSTFEIAHRGYLEVQEVARLEHEHVTQLRALADVSVRINAAPTTAEVLQRTVDAARQVLGVSGARIVSLAGDASAEAPGASARAGEASAVAPDAPVGAADAPARVALRSGDRVLGLLELTDDGAERTFSPREKAILAQLGQLASVALAKSQAYMRERHIAHVLQRSLLPPQLARVPGLTASVRFIAAGDGVEVGGDFYDFFQLRPGGAAALIGDVCGKGPEAASVTALARHTLRAAAVYERRPSKLLELLHGALREARDDGRFCTVAYCELAVHGGGARMTLACGGHPQPLVLRRSGTVEPVGVLGTLLGAGIEPALTDMEVDLAPGELVVLYTDGVTDVRAGRREIFGHSDLIALLETCAGQSADVVAERVESAVLDAAVGRPRDDIAVLVVGPVLSPGGAAPDMLAGAHPLPEATDGRS